MVNGSKWWLVSWLWFLMLLARHAYLEWPFHPFCGFGLVSIGSFGVATHFAIQNIAIQWSFPLVPNMLVDCGFVSFVDGCTAWQYHTQAFIVFFGWPCFFKAFMVLLLSFIVLLYCRIFHVEVNKRLSLEGLTWKHFHVSFIAIPSVGKWISRLSIFMKSFL